MKIKKFTAKTMPEAMQLIRAELGDEAVILNSKEIETGGFLGFFTKKQLEVIVAIDSDEPRKRQKKQPVQQLTLSRETKQRKVEAVSPKKDDLIEELSELKKLVHGLSDQLDAGRQGSMDYPEPFQQIHDQLEEQGVSETVRLTMMKQLLKNWTNEGAQKLEINQLYTKLDHYIGEELKKVSIGGIDFTKKIVTIVGPTGVGKTTTIAKVAAHCVLKKHKKVALITTDTYRIAAVEQLKTYAKILNIPLEVAYSIEDFKRAITQFEQYDLIIVDSAGRNFRNQLYVEELSKTIDFEEQVQLYLTLSLTSKYEDMKEIINQFSILPIDQVILTKEDETGSLGALLNIPLELKKGIAYITNGQNVPDDLVEANIPYIKAKVLGVESHE